MWQNRIIPSLAFVFVLAAVALVLIFQNNAALDKVIVFAGTLIGTITGFYFAHGSNTPTSAESTESTKPPSNPSTSDEKAAK
jgi:hypothetical protein